MRPRITLAVVLLIAGCSSSGGLRSAGSEAPPSLENLHATLWVATAAEYRVSARQAYVLARIMLERALADSSWTALPAQEDAAGYRELPPAVVLDVDETVLDNTTYQARLIRDGASYSGATWSAWVQEAAAVPVPGALEFTRAAADIGVRVIYLTNRDADGEEATRRNLAAFGFPIVDDPDAVITQGERPEWRPSDKEPRRLDVASRNRILLLVGDNLGDFVSLDGADTEGRDRLVERNADRWGTQWIVLPNPQYGSWESSLFGGNYRLPPAERMEMKLDAIRRRAGSQVERN